MKTKDLFGLIAIVGVVVLILGTFLSAWGYSVDGKIVEDSVYTIWGGFGDGLNVAFEVANGAFASVWATLAMVFFIIALVAGVALTIVVLIDMFSKKGIKNAAVIIRWAAIAALIASVLSFVFGGIVFTSVNSFTVPVTKIVTQMVPMIGMYMILVGGIITGAAGFLAAKK